MTQHAIFQAHVSWVSSFFEGTIRWDSTGPGWCHQNQLRLGQNFDPLKNGWRTFPAGRHKRGSVVTPGKIQYPGNPSLLLLGPKTKFAALPTLFHYQTDLLKNVFTWEVIRWSGSEWMKKSPHLFRVKLGFCISWNLSFDWSDSKTDLFFLAKLQS